MTNLQMRFRGAGILAGLALAAAFFAAAAFAQPQPAIIDTLLVTGLSADGSVACGNSGDGLYEACRWTAAEGLVRLGRSTVAVSGTGGGVPGISVDGNAISSTVATDDSLRTQGVWTKGLGWQFAMPPVPADGGLMDGSYGTAWSLSGDGQAIVGLYWRPTSSDGTAHASRWTAADGVVDLGSQGRDSRANGANYDGSVVVGWSASNTISVWQPTVWDDDGMTVLSPSILWCEAWATNRAGDIIVGDTADTLNYTLPMNAAAMWRRTPSGWEESILGVLPGTFGNGTGQAAAWDLSEDGSVVVGINNFDGWNQSGFVWTETQGMMKADDYFADLGAVFPDGYKVSAVTAVSEDGLVMGGYGKNPYAYSEPPRGFVIDLHGVSAVPVAPAEPALALVGVHPNPFNPTTNIELDLPRADRVRLDIFDARGRLVRTVHDGMLAAGRHVLPWDGRDGAGRAAASGVYLARARGSDGAAVTRTMTLVK